MRRWPFILAVAAATPAFSQAPPGDDAGNGALTRDDVEMQAATNFGMFDTDEDGALTTQEINAPRQTALNLNALTRRLERGAFSELDADKNGWLSVAEYTGGLDIQSPPTADSFLIVFAHLDTDRNGRVTLEEYLKLRPPSAPLKINAAMGDYDSNKDGKISRAEFQARAMAEFDRLDLDKDGVIRGAEQTLKCTEGFGSATFLAPAEAVRPLCQEAGK